MSGSLAINRLELALHAPAREAGQGKAFCRDVARALPHHLESRLGGEDSPVLLIRRMTVELSHDFADGAETLAARLAEAIACGIAKVRGTNAGAIQFPNRAAFAAAYLRGRLDGHAARRWWFRSFEGLAALSESATLRTLLGRDWSSALAVLAACDESTRARLWLVLDRHDAAVILAAIAEHGDGGQGGRNDPGVPDAHWSQAAALLLAALADGLAAEVATLAAVAALAAESQHEVAFACCALAEPLQPVLAELGRAARHSVVRSEARLPQWAVLARAQGLPTPLVTSLEDGLDPKAEVAGAAREAQWRASDWLGYALVWPFVAQAVPDDIADWPAPGAGVAAADLLQWLVLSACSGGEGPLRDGVWRDLFGLPGPWSDGETGHWLERVGPARWTGLAAGWTGPAASSQGLVPLVEAQHALSRCAGEALGRIAARLPGFADSTAEFLRANLLGSGGVARFDKECVQVRLRRPPLDVLLGMTGLAERSLELPDGRLLTLERAR